MELKRIEDFNLHIKENSVFGARKPINHIDYSETKKDTLYYVIRYPGITVTEIEKKTGHNPYRIKSALDELEKEGQITISGGMTKDEPYKHYPNEDYVAPRMPPSTSMNQEVNNQILSALKEDSMGLGIADLMALTGYNMVFIQNAMDNLESAGLVRLEGGTYFSNE
jgi:DNA-binding transcriptional regulator YhcF (GntR family)